MKAVTPPSDNLSKKTKIVFPQLKQFISFKLVLFQTEQQGTSKCFNQARGVYNVSEKKFRYCCGIREIFQCLHLSLKIAHCL